MPDHYQPATTPPDTCPDCGVIPGAFHTPPCGARDSGQHIWPGFRAAPLLALQISELRGQLDRALDRIGALEACTPQARQVQYEADLAAADLAASGYDDRPDPIGTDRHGPGCQCPYCYDEPEPDDYDPGPECDDQGGMSEYRAAAGDSEALS